MISIVLATVLGLPANCTGCSFAGRDLHGANLSQVSFVGVDFERANLRDANLRNANLTGVDFGRADLRDADFSGANLTGVDFSGADLRRTDLHGARLCWRNENAKIGCADLRGADVRGADLRGVLVCRGSRSGGSCESIDSATLRREARSNLDGALL